MVRRCPICRSTPKADAPKEAAPFCSLRCKTIDLGQWLGEGYRVPVEETDPTESDFDLPS